LKIAQEAFEEKNAILLQPIDGVCERIILRKMRRVTTDGVPNSQYYPSSLILPDGLCPNQIKTASNNSSSDLLTVRIAESHEWYETIRM
jgi:hypothetical protein